MSDFRAVDARLYDIAGEVLMSAPDAEELSDRELEQVRRRLALAIQQAVDQEIAALRKARET